MSKPIFDTDSWEPMFKISKDMAVDSKGRFSIRLDDNVAMDMDTGDLRFTTPWSGDGDGSEF